MSLRNLVTAFLASPCCLLLALSSTACASDEDNDDSSSDGHEYYAGSRSAALGVTGNESRCATCHSDDGSQAPFSGNTFQDIAYKSSYKGGGAMTLLDASNVCISGWMGGEPLAENDQQWRGLKSFLESISDRGATEPNALAPEVLEDEAAYELAYTGGDAAAGESKYASYCASCHAGGMSVGSVDSPLRTLLATKSIGRIAQQVRTSGPPPSGSADTSDSTPGPMPFFEPRDLSAEDLKDIIAAIKG